MKSFVFSLLLITCNLQLLTAAHEQKICLNMIVKNEEKVIARCLESVKDLVDYWVVVDTGSNDQTKEVIKKTMSGIPGEIHDKPFVNFGQTRNEALALAKGKCDYILFMDADDQLVFSPNFAMPVLDKDVYLITNRKDSKTTRRKQLIRDKLNWNWFGVIEEDIKSDQVASLGILSSITNECGQDGCRSSDINKNHKDIQMLEKALSADPNNKVYTYQLARSCKLIGDYKKSYDNFQKLISLETRDEHRYIIKLELAKMLQEVNAPSSEVIKAYTDAHQSCLNRAEPLYYLANYYLQTKEYLLANIVSDYGKSIHKPFDEEALEVEEWIYNYGILMIYTDSAFFAGKYDKAYKTCLGLLAQKYLPSDIRTKLEKNLPGIKEKLVGQKKSSKEANVYLLTMMKSGTHLIDKFLRLLLAKEEQEYQYAKSSSSRIKSLIRSMDDYKIRFCHIPQDKNTPLFDQLYNRKKILLIRDPRDVLISGSYFIPKIFELSKCDSPPVWAVDYITKAGPFLEKWNELPIEQRLSSIIERKVPESLYKFTPLSYQQNIDRDLPPFNIAEQIPVATEYMNSPNTLVIRFEELVGPAGGGTREAQFKCMEKIANFIGVPFNQPIYKKIAKDLFGTTYTFRSGKKSSWEKLFTSKHKELFKLEYGKDLMELGYEKNNNW